MSLNLNGKKLAVVGSRTFTDKAKLYEVLTKNYDRIKIIVSGGAQGADSLAVEWAKDYGVPYLVFPAAWYDPFTGEYDKGAGFRRNRFIVNHCDVVIAFWDGESKGTQHTISMAQESGKPIKIYKFVPESPVKQWFKTLGGPCCSTSKCEHQNLSKQMERLLLKAFEEPDDNKLMQACGVGMEKIQPIIDRLIPQTAPSAPIKSEENQKISPVVAQQEAVIELENTLTPNHPGVKTAPYDPSDVL